MSGIAGSFLSKLTSLQAVKARSNLGLTAAYLSKGMFVSGRYYFPAGSQTNTGLSTSATLGIGTLRLYPWIVPSSLTLNAIGAEITSAGDAGSFLHLGIYGDDGTGRPGSLILDAGTIAGDNATVQEVAINLTLSTGIVWIGAAVQNVSVTQPTVRTTSITEIPMSFISGPPAAGATIAGYSQTNILTSLPASFGVPSFLAGSCPRIHVKVA